MMSVWTCARCKQGIRDTARADNGKFYHINCWKKEQEEEAKEREAEKERHFVTHMYDFSD